MAADPFVREIEQMEFRVEGLPFHRLQLGDMLRAVVRRGE